MCSLVLLVCPATSKGGSEERARMVSTAFYVAQGGVPGQNGISHSHWTKFINSKLQ